MGVPKSGNYLPKRDARRLQTDFHHRELPFARGYETKTGNKHHFLEAPSKQDVLEVLGAQVFSTFQHYLHQLLLRIIQREE